MTHEKMFRQPAYLGELQKSHMTLAIADGKIIGSAGWCFHMAKTARIRKVFVNPDHCRSGLGRTLMNHVENEIRQAGLKEIFLRASLNAVGFYEKFGYQGIRQEDMVLVDEIRAPVMVMSKRLD